MTSTNTARQVPFFNTTFLFAHFQPTGSATTTPTAPPSLGVDQYGRYTLRTGHFRAWLKKRDDYPVTFCKVQSEGRALLGYGSLANPGHEDEFLRIAIHTNAITVTRDCFATLPIFYTAGEDGLYLSNSYEEIVRQAKKSPPSDHVLAWLMAGGHNLQNGAWWPHIKLLGERQTLLYANGKVTIQQPPSRTWPVSSQAKSTDPKQYRHMLDSWFEYFVRTRLQSNNCAFELSGGLDSCTLPLYLKQKYPTCQLQTISYIYPDSSQAPQQAKLATLQATLQARPMHIPIHHGVHYPLAGYIARNSKEPFMPYGPPYEDLIQEATQALSRRGVTILVVGTGGDDIHENLTDPMQNCGMGEGNPLASNPPPFFTAKQLAAWREFGDRAAKPSLPLLPASYLQAGISVNNIYIQQGIWPISQFASPTLYEFCQGLPAYLRENKNILRAYHQARGFPRQIYDSVANEDFVDFFARAFHSGFYDERILQLLEHSVTVQRGLADPAGWKRFLGMLHGQPSKTAPGQIPQWCYYALNWMRLEMNIQNKKEP